MEQLAKEYIENYLTFANKLTSMAIECTNNSGGTMFSLNDHVFRAAEKAVPMIEILALEKKSKSQ